MCSILYDLIGVKLDWMVPIFQKGWKQMLKQSDIPIVPNDIQSTVVSDKLQCQWEKYNSLCDGPISLAKTIWRTYLFDFSISQLLTAIEELFIKIMQPICLGLLLQYLSNEGKYSKAEGFMFALGVCVLAFGFSLTHHPNFFILMRLSLKIRVSLSALVFRKAVKLSSNSLGEISIGKIVNHLSNDIRKFDESVLFLPYLWIAPVQIFIVGWILWTKVGPISIVGLFLLIMYIPLQSTMGRIYAKLRTKINFVSDERSRLMNEIISGMKVIKMYSWEYAFAEVVAKIRWKEFYLLRKMNLYRAVNNGLFMISTKVIMLITLTSYVLQEPHGITAEKIFVTLTLFYVLRLSVSLFFQIAVSSGSEAWASIKRLHIFLTLKELDESKSKLTCSYKVETQNNPFIALENLTVKAGKSENLIISGINMKINSKELLVIIGPVGSGKSCLLMSILGELPICEGNITVSGKLAYVPQEPWIFAGSIRNNILFGSKFDEVKYKKAISACALKEDIDQFPCGDKTLVGERGALMSGGQKQRICLARALYFDADIYILDDPLSAVDAKVCQHLFKECIQTCLKDKIKILVTHQLQYVKYASQILVLKGGISHFYGTYSELSIVEFDLNSFLKNPEVSCVLKEDEQKSFSGRKSNQHTIAELIEENIESTSDPIEIEENQAVGKVTFRIYTKFLMAGGGIVMGMVILFTNIAAHFLSVSTDWWLSVWVDVESHYNTKHKKVIDAMNETSDQWNNIHDTSYYHEIFVILSVASMVFLISSAVANFMMCVIAARNLHNEMFSHLLHSPLSFFTSNPIGRVLNRFTKDIGQIDDMIATIFHDTVSLGLLSIAIVLMVTYINFVILFPIFVLFGMLICLRKFYLHTLRDLKRLEAT
ncbi:Multidrug resistance-associated protein 4 [Nymphon striatum]|nr:Multidrug resistance-associated protein 4 [Nymphon striatum]